MNGQRCAAIHLPDFRPKTEFQINFLYQIHSASEPALIRAHRKQINEYQTEAWAVSQLKHTHHAHKPLLFEAIVVVRDCCTCVCLSLYASQVDVSGLRSLAQ